MKEKLTKNLGIKLLSVPLAAIIWIVIINIDDPFSTRTISNVPVEILNESYITASGQVYDIVEGNTVSVTVRAKRSTQDKIKATDLRITANLAEITQFNRVEIVAECTKYIADGVELTVKPKMLAVTLEDSATKTMPVQVSTTGVVDSGYYVDIVKASPNMIEVTGAESVVDTIAEIRVSVDVSGNQENFKKSGLVPKAYDDKGREIDSSKLEFSHSEIKAKATILPTKIVPVVVSLEGEPALGYTAAEVEYGPEHIEIAGEPNVLSKIFSIPVTVNVKDANKNMEKDIELAPLIPPGTKLVGDTANIALRITIEKMEEKNFIVRPEDITVENLLEDREVIFFSEINPVTVIGEKENLDMLTIEDLNAYVDLAGLEDGSHMVKLTFHLNKNIQVSGLPTIKIKIKPVDASEELPEDEPSESTPPESGSPESSPNVEADLPE
ncbi:MAG: CdaR family protein [Acetivibrio sp.]